MVKLLNMRHRKNEICLLVHFEQTKYVFDLRILPFSSKDISYRPNCDVSLYTGLGMKSIRRVGSRGRRFTEQASL